MNQNPDLPSAYNLVALDSVTSTMAEARKRASEGEETAPDGTLIWANTQTEGKGRLGRDWYSPPGNLYLTLILRPEVPLPRVAELGFVASLAVYDTLGTLIDPGHQAHCKWPNDVLLNEAKIAGILMECHGGNATTPPDWALLGIGMNLLHAPDKTPYPATSMLNEGCPVVEPGVALQAFARHLLNWVEVWLADGFAPIRENWLWRAYGKGKQMSVCNADKTITGIFEDIDKTGALIIRTDTGLVTLSAGDVMFGGMM